MRFDTVMEFDVNELLLDEGNYRFRKANDQRQCIEKIYQASPENFKNIMTSIAEDDVGELLLVYLHPCGDYIVLDGNRRTSALKVLKNPDLAPTEFIKKRAYFLIEKYKINFEGIQAQASGDKNAILRTIYERHGSTGGKTRLNWPAIAKSRFGYDHDLEMTDAEWKVIAMLYKLEDLNPDLTAFIESSDYKHEVFRRILPAAIKKGIISPDIFSDRDKKIKKSVPRKVKDANEICLVFFDDIKNGVIGLKRGIDAGIYASAEGVDKYLNKFDKKVDATTSDNNGSVDNKESSAPDSNSNNTESSEQAEGEGSSTTNGSSNPNSSAGSSSTPKPAGSSGNYGVTLSTKISEAINKTNSKKFEDLYNSICTISLIQHASLVVIGSWAFLEAIATATGKTKGIALDSYYSKGNLSQLWPSYFKATDVDDIITSLTFIRKEANAIKHSATYRSDHALNLRAHFECLEKLIVKSLEKIVNDNTSIH